MTASPWARAPGSLCARHGFDPRLNHSAPHAGRPPLRDDRGCPRDGCKLGMSTPARKRAWACACKAGPRLRRTRGQKLHAVAAQHRRHVALKLLMHAGAAQARALDEEGRVAHIPARQAGLGLGSRPALAWLTMHHTRQRARQPARAAEEQCSAGNVSAYQSTISPEYGRPTAPAHCCSRRSRPAHRSSFR